MGELVLPKCMFMKGKDLGKNGWKAKVVVFMKTLAPKYSPMPINPRNHTTPTWARGLARSLFFLTWETAQLYKGKSTPESGLPLLEAIV